MTENKVVVLAAETIVVIVVVVEVIAEVVVVRAASGELHGAFIPDKEVLSRYMFSSDREQRLMLCSTYPDPLVTALH